MKILIIGLPYFSKKLADALNVHEASFSCSSLIGKTGFLSRLSLYIGVLRCHLVYSVSGSIGIKGTNVFDFALALKKKVIMHWVGTDVLEAISTVKAGKFKAHYIKNITHYCEVDWIQEELKQVGIMASIVPFASIDDKISIDSVFPKTFSILTYMNMGRENFYGIDKIIQLANEFPDVTIKIAGISEYTKQLPTNIVLLGWIDDMASLYADSVLYLRLPEHDGLAFSVLEALANGCYVGYSYPMENTFYIKSFEDLKELVADLKATFKSGRLHANYEGKKMISSSYSKDNVLGNLASKVKVLING